MYVYNITDPDILYMLLHIRVNPLDIDCMVAGGPCTLTGVYYIIQYKRTDVNHDVTEKTLSCNCMFLYQSVIQ